MMLTNTDNKNLDIKKELAIPRKEIREFTIVDFAQGTRIHKEVTNKIFEICEGAGATTKVDSEYYKSFLEMPDQELGALIKCVVFNTADYINENVLTGKWKSDEDIHRYITTFLNLMARGIMGVREKDGKLVFNKPVGDPPSEDIEKKLDEKFKNAAPLINEKIQEMLKPESN